MIACSRRSDGFTLVEAIVAVVLFATVVVMLQAGFARGIHGVRTAGRELVALDCARSALATAGNTVPLIVGHQDRGSCNGVDWELSVMPYQSQPEDDATKLLVAAFWVDVTATWRDLPTMPLRTLELRTLKLAKKS